MARKKDEYYYDTFVELVQYSCKAAELLNQIMHNFKVDELENKVKAMHDIENSGDRARHVMTRKLLKEFITPIEREDIMELANSIDDVTDAIEDVVLHMYMYNVTNVRPYALKMTDVIVKCCDSLKQAMGEFHNFRKSKELHELIVKVNQFEEDGDKLYTEAMRDLHVNCNDFKEVAAWESTFHFLEKCCDTCEEVANAMEDVIMKNS
ncbi:MAG: putative pit accessory protein [Firmicutes bacterium ADurb.Bin419]|nr:MAG: putative pit accessory protein [Firmicutes bacterium ADurb.Bin419]